jgi:hypothetical protein
MKNLTLILSTLSLTACASLKYPNWEYVRLEQTVPSPSCIYKVQEACSKPLNTCLDWHKQRATTFDADTVVIQREASQTNYGTSFWTGQLKGGESSSTVAEYYYCNGSKNYINLSKAN